MVKMKVTGAYEKVKKQAVTWVIRIVSSLKIKGSRVSVQETASMKHISLFDHGPAADRFKAEFGVQAMGIPGEQQAAKPRVFGPGFDMRYQRRT